MKSPKTDRHRQRDSDKETQTGREPERERETERERERETKKNTKRKNERQQETMREWAKKQRQTEGSSRQGRVGPPEQVKDNIGGLERGVLFAQHIIKKKHLCRG